MSAFSRASNVILALGMNTCTSIVVFCCLLTWQNLLSRWFHRCNYYGFPPAFKTFLIWYTFLFHFLLLSSNFLSFHFFRISASLFSFPFCYKTMASPNMVVAPAPDEFSGLQEWFGFLPDHGVDIPQRGFVISWPPECKVGVPLPIFEAWLRLPRSTFLMRSCVTTVSLSTTLPLTLLTR